MNTFCKNIYLWGTGSAVFPPPRLLSGLPLLRLHKVGCEALGHPGDTATPGGPSTQAFLTANEGAREASAHGFPEGFASSASQTK